MARHHRRRKRVFYYACLYKLASTFHPGTGAEQDWQLVHWLPSRTPERAIRTAARLRHRFPGYEYEVDAPAVRYILGDEPA